MLRRNPVTLFINFPIRFKIIILCTTNSAVNPRYFLLLNFPVTLLPSYFQKLLPRAVSSSVISIFFLQLLLSFLDALRLILGGPMLTLVSRVILDLKKITISIKKNIQITITDGWYNVRLSFAPLLFVFDEPLKV